MTDRYTEMEMTAIARREFKRGKADEQKRILEIIDNLFKYKCRYYDCEELISEIKGDGK